MASPIPAIELRSVDDGEYGRIPRSAGLRAPTAGTYWRTLRHLQWSQLGYLALRRMLPRSHAPAAMNAPVRLCDVAGSWRFKDWQPEAARQMLGTRDFTFLNRTVARHGAIPWNDRRHARLWLYHLNYFDFLNVDLAWPEEASLLAAALEMMLDWCAHNRQGTEVGWEPYPLSVRIVNWLKFLARHGRAPEFMEEGGRINALLESLGVQVATLERRLEKDLLANHLLKNIKALLFAGAALETQSSTRWWSKGEVLLTQQLHEQILPDGGHFERSPLYHSQVLEDLVEIRLWCAATGKYPACADLLSQKIHSMAEFLRGILHPDGEIPLFNDSALGGARPPAELLAMVETPDAQGVAGERPVILFPATGYGIIRSRAARSTLIFDCGPLGPDYQPGHGHCDVLSYELSLHGQRVVVDTGASTYEHGAVRCYERATAAHNTLRIDGEEQSEIWGSFRVGRRPRVGQLRGSSNGVLPSVRGEHDAWRRLGVIHARTILFRHPDTWIVVDLLRGDGSHLVEAFLHFHPMVNVEAQTEIPAGLPLRSWTLDFADQSYLLTTYGDGQFELGKSWYAEQFGSRQPSTALRWAWQGTLPAGMIHVFTPAGAALPHLAADWRGESIEIDGHKIPLC
jgi:uncharacterized heparinase superfamily protein